MEAGGGFEDFSSVSVVFSMLMFGRLLFGNGEVYYTIKWSLIIRMFFFS